MRDERRFFFLIQRVHFFIFGLFDPETRLELFKEMLPANELQSGDRPWNGAWKGLLKLRSYKSPSNTRVPDNYQIWNQFSPQKMESDPCRFRCKAKIESRYHMKMSYLKTHRLSTESSHLLYGLAFCRFWEPNHLLRRADFNEWESRLLCNLCSQCSLATVRWSYLQWKPELNEQIGHVFTLARWI